MSDINSWTKYILNKNNLITFWKMHASNMIGFYGRKNKTYSSSIILQCKNAWNNQQFPEHMTLMDRHEFLYGKKETQRHVNNIFQSTYNLYGKLLWVQNQNIEYNYIKGISIYSIWINYSSGTINSKQTKKQKKQTIKLRYVSMRVIMNNICLW